MCECTNEIAFSHIQDTLVQQINRLNRGLSDSFCVSLVWLNMTFPWQWSGIQHQLSYEAASKEKHEINKGQG